MLRPYALVPFPAISSSTADTEAAGNSQTPSGANGTLMVVEDTRVGHTGRPRSEHAASIAAGNHKVAFRQRQRNVPRTQVVANAAKLGVVQLPRLHQLLPGRIRVAPIQLAPQHRLARRIGIEHVMEREILNMFARHLAHARRPTAVAPGDQLNRWINCAHGSCKLDGLACRGFEVEAILVVGRFVTDLPMPDSQRSRV